MLAILSGEAMNKVVGLLWTCVPWKFESWDFREAKSYIQRGESAWKQSGHGLSNMGTDTLVGRHTLKSLQWMLIFHVLSWDFSRIYFRGFIEVKSSASTVLLLPKADYMHYIWISISPKPPTTISRRSSWWMIALMTLYPSCNPLPFV